MAANTEESGEKVFELYQDFPPETRMMIVDQMEPSDRCRFTGCSKLSEKEGKSSSNYLYGLEICSFSNETSTVVHHSSFDPYDFEPIGGYIMKFHKTFSDELHNFEDPMLDAMYQLCLSHIEAGNLVITQKPNTNYMTWYELWPFTSDQLQAAEKRA